MSPAQFKSIVVVDDHTVQVNTTQHIDILYTPQPILIIPNNSFGTINFATEENGSGPFKVTSFTSGTSVSLAVQPDLLGRRAAARHDELPALLGHRDRGCEPPLRAGRRAVRRLAAAPEVGPGRARQEADPGCDLRRLVDHPVRQAAAERCARAQGAVLLLQQEADERRLVRRPRQGVVEPLQVHEGVLRRRRPLPL